MLIGPNCTLVEFVHDVIEKDRPLKNKAVYTEGLVACCWAGAVTILYTRHQVLAELLLIVSIAQIVLSCQFG